MQPVLKEKVWGGHRLAGLLGKNASADRRIGESWELADHPHGTSTVAEGPMRGKSLREVLKREGEAVLGRALAARGYLSDAPSGAAKSCHTRASEPRGKIYRSRG